MEKTKEKKKKGPYEAFFKRFFDVIISLLAIVILSPIMLIIYIISLIVLKGNPIFKQYRPGKDNKIFAFYKFRSMTNKTDKDGNLLPDKDRITTYGKFLRKTSLDELPQLFNILKGDMSIVGPRPRLVKDAIFYSEEVLSFNTVRPGITCLSQISGGRSEASWQDIFEKDMKYINNITFWGDVKILFKTVFAIFKKEGKGAAEGAQENSGLRDYYYADYLLKTNQITEEQYKKGLENANQIIESKGTIKYNAELHQK